MRLPHFRVRTLMVAVGIVALIFWGTMMGSRSYRYGMWARTYGMEERLWREHAKRDLARGATQTVAARWGLQTADYYAPLARKYRRAMWRPWESVAPDPPAPVFDSP